MELRHTAVPGMNGALEQSETRIVLPAPDREPEHVSPTSPDRMASRIARVVQRRTGGRIRDLRVDVTRDTVVLHGTCNTYYSKQLAQHAVMCFAFGGVLVNDIRVV